MTRQVFTFGYSGADRVALVAAVEALDAILVDVRFNPASRNPQWSGKQLRAVLGDRYLHAGVLGNRAYRSGGAVEIVDLDAGVRLIEMNTRPVILMCMCSGKDAAHCHRHVVGDHLVQRGFAVRELELLPIANQPQTVGPWQGRLL